MQTLKRRRPGNVLGPERPGRSDFPHTVNNFRAFLQVLEQVLPDLYS